MNDRRLLLLATVVSLVMPSCGALAQGFSSVSSAPRAPSPTTVAPVQTAAVPAQAATMMAPVQAAFATSPAAAPARSGRFETADRIVVRKGERRLYLLRSEDIIAEYPIRLGLNPHGPKQREGDFRTPEGTYQLVRRNPRSDFFLSLEVSYPNATDRARARGRGVQPGGLIMIHGLPNVPRKPPDYYAGNDWTDGCIAVSNSDMVDIWLRTDIGVPIEIRP
jgi:murein L,D-transpeptidase YafK